MTVNYDPQALHDGLVRHGHIFPVGVKGAFGRGPVFEDIVDRFDELVSWIARDDGAQHLQTIGWALKMNNLKIRSSELAPQIVHEALQIIGVLAYKNDSPFSVGRQYRDALSGALMISNDRIVQQSSSMLLVFKDE